MKNPLLSTTAAPAAPAASPKKYLSYVDVVARGDINNRQTLGRWQRAGLYPPSIDLGFAKIGFLVEDIEERDRRVREGIVEPNPDWIRRTAEREARDPHKAEQKKKLAQARARAVARRKAASTSASA